MKPQDAPSAGLANHEIVTIAVYLAGGATRSVDTEDIAVKANELAPGRFAWQKYKDQISLDAVRKRLWDAKSEDKGYQYLSGSEKDGWMLTATGALYVQQIITSLPNLELSKKRTSSIDRKWRNRERVRLLGSDAYRKLSEGRAELITSQDAASFFRLDEYITGAARKRKIDRIVNAFHDDNELTEAIKAISTLIQKDENHGH